VSAVLWTEHGAKLTWLGHNSPHCPVCGPRARAQQTAILAKTIDDPVTAVQVAATAWPKLKRRLQRGRHNYLRVPVSDAEVLVLSTADLGDPVSDVDAWLQTALARAPAGSRISTSKSWSLASRRKDSEATLAGISSEGPAQMRAVARAEGSVGLGEHGELPRAGDPRAWARFVRTVGLHRPERRPPRSEPKPEDQDFDALADRLVTWRKVLDARRLRALEGREVDADLTAKLNRAADAVARARR